MPTRQQRIIAERRKEREPHPDMLTNPKPAEVSSALQKELATAKKKLEQKMALQDQKAVQKLKQIIDNLEGTIARQKLQQQKL